MLGLFALSRDGLTGCVIVLVAHGFSSAGLFLLAGMLYERRHTRQIAAFGGLARPLPRLAALFTLITLSAIGLPATAGFVGEFSALFGAFPRYPGLVVVGGLGVVLGAVYMLWTVQRVFYGPLEIEENRRLSDASPREMLVLVPLVLAIFAFGLWPRLLTDRSAAAVRHLAEYVQKNSRPPATALPPEGILIPMTPLPPRPPAVPPAPRPETGRGAVTPPVSPAATPTLPPIPTFWPVPSVPATPGRPAEAPARAGGGVP
jgi:NADH-quinone oxidoreductase subunit M